jgi:hypothetical protein
MKRCDTCGNEYERTFEVLVEGRTYVFDCFECAIHKLAPLCEHCGVRVIGHGLEADKRMFCCAHCARARGIAGLSPDIWEGYPGGGRQGAP